MLLLISFLHFTLFPRNQLPSALFSIFRTHGKHIPASEPCYLCLELFPGSVILNPEYPLESPGEFFKSLIPEPNRRPIQPESLGVGPGISKLSRGFQQNPVTYIFLCPAPSYHSGLNSNVTSSERTYLTAPAKICPSPQLPVTLGYISLFYYISFICHTF